MAQANIKAVITAEDRSDRALNGFSRKVGNLGTALAGAAKTASVALVAATGAATAFAVKSAASFQQTRIGLENMLGSADNARKLLRDISDFAAKTPFEFPELAQAAKQLVAFGFSAEEAYNTMKELGNVSAAVGAPINDLAYLMGTLRTQGRAFTIDIRQFAQRGIPIYEQLGKVLGKNTEQISAMIEAGEIGFPEVQKAFQDLAGEGGRWGNTMETQSKSLNGLLSTLKDTLGQTARELVGITQEGDIKEGSLMDNLIKGSSWLITNLPRMVETLKSAVQAIIPQLQQWYNNVMLVVNGIAIYLQPKIEALWHSIQDNLAPALSRLWHDVLDPLITIFGGAFILALGLAIDSINFMSKVISTWINVWMTVIQWIKNFVKAIVDAAVWVGEKVAQLNEWFRSIPDFIREALKDVYEIITSPFTKAFDAIKNGVNSVKDSVKSLGTGAVDVGKGAVKGGGNILKSLLSPFHPFSEGGFTGTGGKHDVAGIVHKGEYVIPKEQVDQTTGQPMMGGMPAVNISINAGAYMGSQQDARKYAMMIVNAYKDAMSMRGNNNGVFA